ncbi:DJ-1/PfpI family protein [Actinokineospora auranticolor]|uniref:Putative intracellular protease/amidase n=1 Tax=Actinokineospora auranticolor TaxID=155976 RepID=A0A2S6GCR0_9PSEU|nr:DJ-1/PfpI family protein [Actinokineospora auranticolor]PPK62768.1 putative intracellular protease/amidase [Actinokineospora auranticolor]
MTNESVNTVHLAVYDMLSDWETGHATATLRHGMGQRRPGSFTVRTVGLDTEPVTTMGGVRIVPDLTLAELSPADSAMLILPGSTGWDTGDDRHPHFARAARTFLDAGVPVAAICGATAGLAREGLLDDRDHTSAAAEYLAYTGYAGTGRYREADAVTDRDLITAGPTDPVAFAREILARLDVYRPEALDAWFRLYAHSDAAAFAVLAGQGADA